LACIFVAVISLNSFSQSYNTKLFMAVDGFAPALKFGVEKNTTERFSLKASVGFCIVGPALLAYNLFSTYIVSNPEKNFGVNLNFGLLDNYIDIFTPVFSLGFGGGTGIYWRFRNSSMLSIRLGIIAGPAIDKKEVLMLSIPNFGIEYAYVLNRNKE